MTATGHEITASEISAAFSPEALELTLMPTEQCNFRCTYCYEDFAIGRMSPEVVAGLRRFLELRIPTLSRLSVNWFGGEPLLARDTVLTISELVGDLTAQHGVSCQVSATTNGYLLDEGLAQRLVAVGVRTYEISLDGPPAQHDLTRVTRGGLGTFARITENLDRLRDSDLDVTVILRLHITPANVAGYPSFLAELRSRYLCDPRFRLLFFPVEHLGGPLDDSFEILDHDTAIAVIRDLSALVNRPQPQTALFGPTYICYAAKPNSLIIRADGRLAKCTVALSDPRNDIGRLNSDGTVDIDGDAHLPWLSGWWRRDRDALRCPLDSLPVIPVEALRRRVAPVG